MKTQKETKKAQKVALSFAASMRTHIEVINVWLKNQHLAFTINIQKSVVLLAKYRFGADLSMCSKDEVRLWLLAHYGRMGKIGLVRTKPIDKPNPASEKKMLAHKEAKDGYKYDFFIKSNYWRKVRDIVLERDNHKCTSCVSTEILQVHHKTYIHHGDEIDYLEDLVTLCKKCHMEVHKIGVKK